MKNEKKEDTVQRITMMHDNKKLNIHDREGEGVSFLILLSFANGIEMNEKQLQIYRFGRN